MTLRDSLLPMVTAIRSIPGQLGIRPNSVSVVIGTWAGSYPGRGAKTSSEVAITEANGQPPKVRALNGEELALGGLPSGSLTIGPITPGHPGGGTPIATLKPALAGALAAGQTVHFKVTGPESPNGDLYALKSMNTDHALHYTLTVTPVEAEP